MNTITELKARAYDLLAAIEGAQRELQQVNAAIGQSIQEDLARQKASEQKNEG